MNVVGSVAEKRRVACYDLGKLGHSVPCPSYEGFAAPGCAESLSRVADAPDGFRAVIGKEQRTIGSDSDTNGATPNVAIVHDEPRHELFVFAGGMTGLM